MGDGGQPNQRRARWNWRESDAMQALDPHHLRMSAVEVQITCMSAQQCLQRAFPSGLPYTDTPTRRNSRIEEVSCSLLEDAFFGGSAYRDSRCLRHEYISWSSCLSKVFSLVDECKVRSAITDVLLFEYLELYRLYSRDKCLATTNMPLCI